MEDEVIQDIDIQNIMLQLQHENFKLRLENEYLQSLLNNKNKTIKLLEYSILDDNINENENENENENIQTPIVTISKYIYYNIIINSLDNYLIKKGLYIHPKISHGYVSKYIRSYKIS